MDTRDTFDDLKQKQKSELQHIRYYNLCAST